MSAFPRLRLPGSEQAKHLHLTYSGRNTWREKLFADDRRKEDNDHAVVKLERAAKRRESEYSDWWRAPVLGHAGGTHPRSVLEDTSTPSAS